MTQYSGKVIRKTPVTPTQQSASGVWTLTDQAAAIRNNLWPVPGVPDPISRSVRLRSSASAYLSRTPAVAGNQQKWTWSGWVKLGAIGQWEGIFNAGSSGNQFAMYLYTDNTLYIQDYNGANQLLLNPTQVFRDPSAWYHIVLAIDTTQATAANRAKLYINGTQVTAFSTATYPAQNYNTQVNSTSYQHNIGLNYQFATSNAKYYDGYMTEINFVDGQQLTPSSFGTTDTATGAWIPMAYTGTYGTNGFYLNFKDNTSTTTIGYDYSGNSNNWTANNISLTAGTTYDSMLDVPTPWVGYSTTTDTSAVTRGNYCVLNPLNIPTTGSPATISNGNLDAVTPSSGYGFTTGTIAASSGKWYWEYVATAGANFSLGFGLTTCAKTYAGDTGSYMYYSNDGKTYANAGAGVTYGATWTTNDVIGVALDLDAGTATFYKNGVSQGQAFSGLSGTFFPVFSDQSPSASNTFTANFGQRPFAYTPPTGYKTLCTTNLSTPTIANGANYMAATLYTGTGSAFTLTGVGFQPDFGWFKGRNASSSHWFHDVVRGANPGLSSNSTAAEDTTAGQLTAFASDGYSLPNDSAGYLNYSGRTMVVWSWKAGGTGSSNTSGSITSTVSVNTTAGFSVVTYTGTGANATVGHGLGVAPNMVIVKNRSAGSTNWCVYHSSLTSAAYSLFLDNTLAQSSYPTVWNSTAPTSTVFSLGTNGSSNASTNSMVAYCWAAVAGFSAFGSYTGNDSADGPFVYCGFRPRWIMFKNTTNSGSWVIFDTSRDTYNVEQNYLFPNQSTAENGLGSVTAQVDYLSNGFKIRANNANAWMGNQSGSTFIYAAFAENPFKYSNAR